MRRGTLVIIGLLCAAAVAEPEVDIRPWAGPLRWPNAHPFQAIFLDQPALDAVLPPEPEWDLRLTHFNTMAYSRNVDTTPAGQALILNATTGAPQTPLDAASLAASAAARPGETFLFADTETTRLDVSYLHPFGNQWAVGVEVPIIGHHGGVFDKVIEGFHGAFNFPNLGRNRAPVDRVQLFAGRGTQSRYYDGPWEPALGDIVIRGFHAPVSEGPEQPAVALTGAIKLPTGPASRFMGSGSPDWGIGLSMAKALGDFRLTFTGGHTWHGRWAGLGSVPIDNTFDAQFGAEYRINDFWSCSAGFQIQEHPLAHAEPSSFGRTSYGVGVGFSHRAGGMVMEGGFFENLTEDQNSYDAGLMLRLNWRD